MLPDPHRLGRLRRSALFSALSLVLWLPGCDRTKPEPTQPPQVPVASGPVDSDPGEPRLEDPRAPRKRPAPGPVTDRAGALEALASGNPEGAAEFLATHLKTNPGDVEARLARAAALAQTGAVKEAADVLAAGDPGDPQLLEARARLAWRVGNLESAEKIVKARLQADPDAVLARGLLLRIWTLTGRGEDPEAKRLMDGLYDSYDAGQAKAPDELYGVALAALTRAGSGAFRDANMVLGDAEKNAPLDPGNFIAEQILLLRGDMFLQKYAGDAAAETYQILLERNPWHPDALAGMARVHLDQLAFGPASRAAREALQVNPHHPEAHAILARIALIEGRRDEARDRVQEEVLEADTSHAEGMAVLAALGIARNAPRDYERWEKAALAVNPRNARFYRDLADVLAFLHHYEAADEILARAAKLLPRDPHIQAAYGLNALRLGHEKEGLAALNAAWKRDHYNERTDNTLKLYEERIGLHYSETTVGDVTIRLPKKDRELVEPRLVESVQRARAALDRAYGIKPGPLRLEFFSSPDEFSVRTIGVPSLGAAAVCFGDLITFVGPYLGTHNLDGVIWHELAHVYAIEKSDSRVPRWFTEGLSEWESEQGEPAFARESAELLMAARRQGKLRKLSELELAFIRAESPQMMEVAYSLAAYAMRYLAETYGRPRLIAMLEGYATGAHTEELMKKHLGVPLTQVEQEFEAWLTLRLQQAVGTGWTPTPGPPDQLDAANRLYVEAMGHVEKQRYDEAASKLEELIKAGGDGYIPQLLLGRVLVQKGQLKEAVPHLEAALKHHAEAIDPLVVLTEVDMKLGDVNAEMEHLRRALAIDANALDPAARLLFLAEITGKKKDRALALRRASAIAPLHPIVLAARALDLGRSRQKKAGAPHLKRALESLAAGKGPADTFVLAALAAAALGETDQAAVLAARARQDPNLPKQALEAIRKL